MCFFWICRSQLKRQTFFFIGIIFNLNGYYGVVSYVSLTLVNGPILTLTSCLLACLLLTY